MAPDIFVECRKMIYLDSDIQVYENVDHLFDLPDGYFLGKITFWCGDCFCKKTWSHTQQYKCPDKVQWQEELGTRPPFYFNTGMFVYEPSLPTCDDLSSNLKITPPTPFAEQDFWNMFFRDVYRPIPPIYYLALAMLWRHPENIELDKMKVIHCCAAGSKPWRYTSKEENMDREDIKMLVKYWWDTYNDETLDYKRSAVATGAETEAKKLKAGVVCHVNAPSAAC